MFATAKPPVLGNDDFDAGVADNNMDTDGCGAGCYNNDEKNDDNDNLDGYDDAAYLKYHSII